MRAALWVSLCIQLLTAASVSAQTESFRNASAPGWAFKGMAALTSGSADASGSGWLRLTSAVVTQGIGFAYFDSALPSSKPLRVSFDYAAWGGAGGEGMSFVLFDGATPNPTAGMSGHLLGYAGCPNGLAGAYLAVQLDELGASPTGCAGGSGNGDLVAVRGGAGTGYQLLTAVPVQAIDAANATSRPGLHSSDYRHVVITLSSGKKLTVQIQFGFGAPLQTVIDHLDVAAAGAAPATWKLGFTAANGDFTNNHEIRNLEVSATSCGADETSCQLLANSGFEEGTYSPIAAPSFWSNGGLQKDQALFLWQATPVFAGGKSVQIYLPTLNDAYWKQSVTVQPNRQYRFCGRVKTQNVAHSPEASDIGANLSILNGLEASSGLIGTNDWTELCLDFNSGTRTHVDLAARLGFSSGKTTGFAWFDNLRLELVSVGVGVCTNFVASGLPVTIPDFDSVSSPLIVGLGGKVTGVGVTELSGLHPSVGDLEFHLISPTGVDVNFMNRVCRSNNSNFDLEIDDAATTAIPCPPIDQDVHDGTSPLSTFLGVPSLGTWTLKIVDRRHGQSGTLQSWGLEVCSDAPPPATPTITATASLTATVTATWTPTQTSTTTRTVTSTPTPTPSVTRSSSPTFSGTSTATRTATSTPSRTPSVTPSSSPTLSGTSTATSTPTRTATVTGTSTPTSTATATPSPTITGTRTSTRTPRPRHMGRWRNIGPDGGSITALAIAPSNPAYVYAASFSVGVIRTSDRGQSWSGTSKDLNGVEIAALAVDPTSVQHVYASGPFDAFETTDGGSSWRRLNNLAAGLDAIAISPTTPTTLFGAAASNILKSTNGGGQWNTALANCETSALAFAPGDAQTLYAGCSVLQRTTDDGATWEVVDGGFTGQALAFAFHPSIPGLLFAVTNDGVFKTDGGGSVWYDAATGLLPGLQRIVLDVDDPETLYVAGTYGVYETRNGGGFWRELNDGLPSGSDSTVVAVHALALAPGNPRGLYAGTSGYGAFLFENSTPTPTQTATPTQTLTPTITATATSTASVTGTATRTSTAAPTATASPSMAPTGTPTLSPSVTPTGTPTESTTATTTSTQSVTPTDTPTRSVTATGTPTKITEATATRTASMSPTATFTSEPTGTRTTSPTGSATVTATSTAPASPTPTHPPTPPPSVTPTATQPPTVCLGDCNGDRKVDVLEILKLLNSALGSPGISPCGSRGLDPSTSVAIEDLVAAVISATSECGRK